MERIKEVDVAKLTVDTGNFRIGEQDGVREAYLAMIEEQRQGLVNLADDIIKLGVSPADPFIVCCDPDHAKSFIVCEGNRRLTCIRLLETPALAADTPYHKKFVALSKLYKKAPIRKVYCVQFADKDAAFVWIERKHVGLDGRGVAQWNAIATGRAKAYRGKTRPSLAVFDYLSKKGMMPEALSKAVRRRTTNLDRVFQMPYMKDALGVCIDKTGEITFGNGDGKKGARLLHKMVMALAERDFTVDKIRYDSDRKDFIDTFAADAVLADGDDQGKRKPVGEKKKDPKKERRGKDAPSPLERNTLAMRGPSFALHVVDPRLSALYFEAKELNPDTLPNAGAILTRVFLELSTDYFLKEKKPPIPERHLEHGKKHWSDIGISLAEKMDTAMQIIDPTGKHPDFKEVRRGIRDKDSLHSIDALHEVMHQLKADRDPKEVKRVWTRWQPYFAAVFDGVTQG